MGGGGGGGGAPSENTIREDAAVVMILVPPKPMRKTIATVLLVISNVGIARFAAAAAAPLSPATPMFAVCVLFAVLAPADDSLGNLLSDSLNFDLFCVDSSRTCCSSALASPLLNAKSGTRLLFSAVSVLCLAMDVCGFFEKRDSITTLAPWCD